MSCKLVAINSDMLRTSHITKIYKVYSMGIWCSHENWTLSNKHHFKHVQNRNPILAKNTAHQSDQQESRSWFIKQDHHLCFLGYHQLAETITLLGVHTKCNWSHSFINAPIWRTFSATLFSGKPHALWSAFCPVPIKCCIQAGDLLPATALT